MSNYYAVRGKPDGGYEKDYCEELIKKGRWQGYSGDINGKPDKNTENLKKTKVGDWFFLLKPGKISQPNLVAIGKVIKKDNNNEYEVKWYTEGFEKIYFNYISAITSIENPEKKEYAKQQIEEILKMEKRNDFINLLKNKNQIILQGPPGTGKTRLAKKIAKFFISKTQDELKKIENVDEIEKLALGKEDGDKARVIQFHPAYSYEDFVRGIVAKTDSGDVSYQVENKILAEIAEKAENDKEKNYVLIIDEINRANLPAVLGELIYALEYRGDAVTSMYEKGGSREIILPKNLYIIGTMNTADRTVGHIDYAIRRRFAFVDILPNRTVITNEKAQGLFDKIDELFNNHTSPDFQKNDVMIGHSYFLGDEDLELKLEYEIKPILREYVKDGILKKEAEGEINSLNV